ncbi:MAG: PKD domain-containing protein, partial [Bacteroidales bacterium]|nr:PKD domain-containing protein [Bacteroidales bacterium]
NPGFGVSENCHVNVNCPEGASWQEQKRGVAEILLSDTWFSGFCSGSLINNAENDGTPYFLSVAHCADGSNYFQQWQFYFNYEAQSCWNPEVAPDYNTIVGASMKAIGSDVTGSDFLLLELNTTEDELEAINAYYNGWDISGDASPSGVGIHHPSGDIKKISTYTGVLSTSSYPTSSAVDAFWRVNWSATQTDYGVTEAGSNGSPLFNNNKLIVGTLTGGASACFAPEQNQFDLYGKMDYHWESNSKSNSGQLKSWLDPQNTGITVLQGREPNSEIQYLIAQFVGSPTTVEIGDTVDFTDQSDSNPTSWLWLFEGGTPDTSTTQNPSVVYDTPGTYDVSLTVSNQYGDDTEVKTGYITVNDYNKVSETEVFQSQINVFPNPNSGEFSIDLGDFDSEVQIRITNINGQELKAKTTKTGKYINVNTDNIPSGLYFLQVITEDFSKVYKITIAK